MSMKKQTPQRFQEVVEAEGHLIDSHIMEQIFDTVIEYHGRFEVEHFHIGRTNADPSRLRLRVEAPDRASFEKMLSQLHALGCAPVEEQDAAFARVERDRCAPEDFYSTTNHRTLVRRGGQWHEVQNQRMDAVIVWENGQAVGAAAARPQGRRRDRRRHARHPRDPRIERARPPRLRLHVQRHLQRAAGGDGRAADRCAHPPDAGLRPARGRRGRPRGGAHRGRKWLASLIRKGYVSALLAGNALGVHDIESALFGTSLGVRLSDGRQEEHGHRNHMRAINRIYHAGSVREAVARGVLKKGVLYECIQHGVPFVLAGSLRDDGPLPETITDMNAAQDAYAEQLRGAGLVLCLGSMLHAIATGNMLPGWVKTVCVDINPAVVTKLGDRGTGQAVGVVTDVGIFLEQLDRHLPENRRQEKS